MSFGTVGMRLAVAPTAQLPMNLRDVKLSSRAVIPVALAIPIAPRPRPLPVVVPDPKPTERDDRVHASANGPNYWL